MSWRAAAKDSVLFHLMPSVTISHEYLMNIDRACNTLGCLLIENTALCVKGFLHFLMHHQGNRRKNSLFKV